MKLAVSCRIAEGFLSKEESILSFAQLCDLAVDAGYDAICMRASQISIHSPNDLIAEARAIIDARNLSVTMISGDFDIVYNNDRGPQCLTHIRPYLDLAQTLGAPMVRVCLKTESDVIAARNAADQAADRGIKLVHQCHVQSLFETIDQIQRRLEQIDRENFGLIFEAANLEECRQDYGPDTIRRLAPWIRNVYLQNQRLSPNGKVTLDTWTQGPISFDIIDIPEPGGIEFPVIFDGLRQIGYQGVVTVHQSAPEDGTSPTESAAATARFLRELM